MKKNTISQMNRHHNSSSEVVGSLFRLGSYVQKIRKKPDHACIHRSNHANLVLIDWTITDLALVS